MAKKKESKEEVKNKKESQVTTEKKKSNKKVDSSVKTEVIDTKKNKELEKKLKQERKKINNISVTDSDIWSKVIDNLLDGFSVRRIAEENNISICLLYTSPSPRDS